MEGSTGRKIKGFKFDCNTDASYDSSMDKYIGMTGDIIKYHTISKSFQVRFSDGEDWWYPAEEALKHLVEQEAKQIFKVGNKVFDFSYGWGNIVEYSERINARYPIKVEFGDETEEYTKEGCLYDGVTNPTLSFTEYTLQGFSQERPIELPEVGELCLVSDSGRDWYCIKFGGYNPKVTDPYISLNGDGWRYIKRIKILD